MQKLLTFVLLAVIIAGVGLAIIDGVVVGLNQAAPWWGLITR